jgi:hypothetical protein
MDKKLTKTDNEKIIKEALNRFEIAQNAERNNRQMAVDDAKFVHVKNGQWDEASIQKRKNRPRYTINRIAGAIDQLTGNQRQQNIGIDVKPMSGESNEEKAKIFDGIIRSIEKQSKATNSYDVAFDEVVTGGYGAWRILTEFNDDDIFLQDIVIEPITSACSSVWFDPSAKKYDKRDAGWCFLTLMMTVEAFKDKYPDAEISDFAQEKFNSGSCQSWFVNGMVRVAEYWKKIRITKHIAQLSDGRIIDLDEEKDVIDELAVNGITVVNQRKVNSHKVVSYIMNGAEVLSQEMPWAGKFIPIIPVFGKVTNIEGIDYVRGLVRNAIDPQRIYNYATSSAIEATALTPKDPIWLTTMQAEGHEKRLGGCPKIGNITTNVDMHS